MEAPTGTRVLDHKDSTVHLIAPFSRHGGWLAETWCGRVTVPDTAGAVRHPWLDTCKKCIETRESG